MIAVQALALFSLASLVILSRAGTMEEFYCTPIWEQYPVTKDGIVYLSSKPRFEICPVQCSLVKTEEVWTTFEVMVDGEKKTKAEWAYSAAKCEYDDWKILGR